MARHVAKAALKSYTVADFFGQLAQLVRAFASHARGQRFESFIVHPFIPPASANCYLLQFLV